MASSLFFNGRQYSTPSAPSQINDSAMAPQSLTVGNVLALIGRCTGSEPNKPVKHAGPTQARRVLKTGDLADAAVAAFAPSAMTNAPAMVVTIRVGKATKASLVVKDTAGADALTIEDADWGPDGNAIKARIEAGTVRGKRVTVVQKENTYQQDNLARDLITVRYAGAEATATITTSPESVVLSVGNATAANISLADFKTIQDLADRIGATPGFTATIATGAARLASSGIDRLTAQDVKTAAKVVTGDLQAIVDWLNSPAVPVVTAKRAASASLPPATMPFTYLTGGTEPAATAEDWQNAFTALQKVEAQAFVPVTGDPAVHAMADAHAIFMSGPGMKERRSFVGGALGQTTSAVITAAKALNSDRSAMCWPGHQAYDADGRLAMLPPYMTAVLVAAGFAGLNPGQSMTNKSLRIAGLETTPVNPTDTDELIQGGVLCIEDTEEGFKVCRAVSTWLASDNYNRVEISCGYAVDFAIRNVRQAVQILRGEPMDELLLARYVTIADSALRELSRPRPAGPGVLVGDEENPPYRNIRARLQGDTAPLEFEASPVIPGNFFPITMSIVPYSGTATAA